MTLGKKIMNKLMVVRKIEFKEYRLIRINLEGSL
jgi:hypothetical protein